MRITFILFLTSVLVGSAYAINLSGVVKNTGGIGIEGATVRLGKANIATTTASDGSFRLTDNTTGVTRKPDRADFFSGCPVIVKHEALFCSVMEQTDVNVQAYDGNGRLLWSFTEPVSSGKHSIALPPGGSGIHIYRVSMNDMQYIFTSVAGTGINRSTASSRDKSAPAMQAKTTAPIDDALLFTKDGYALSRLPVKKTDTSGLQITMNPLETGTVTDADGNVYQTVRIGNQFWTVENLRTTKYNDGTGIPLVTDNASWGRGTAGYCFYNNATDPAARKKWGAIYNWSAVKTGKLAPKGWHVSTDAEWDTLQNYLMRNGYNYDGTIDALARDTFESDDNKIAKSLATKTDWPVDSEGTGSIGNDVSQNNASGFSALPSGSRLYDGSFFDQGNFCFFWTATETDGSFAWYRHLWDVTTDLNRGNRVKLIGCSVRLVRLN